MRKFYSVLSVLSIAGLQANTPMDIVGLKNPQPRDQAKDYFKSTDASDPFSQRKTQPKLYIDESLRQQKANKNLDKVFVTLKSINLTGNTAIPKAQLQAIWRPYVGKRVSVQTVFDISAKISDRYRNEGYVTSMAYLPPQEISGGHINIQVVEGFISQTSVDPRSTRFAALYNYYLAQIRKKRPFNLKEADNYIYLAQKTPGYTVHPIVKADPAIDHGTSLIFNVKKEKAASAYFNTSNYTRDIGFVLGGMVPNIMWQSKTYLNFDSAYILKHSTGVDFKHTQFLNKYGTRGYFEYKYTRSDKIVSTDSGEGELKRKTSAHFFNVMVMHPLVYKRDAAWKMRGSLDINMPSSEATFNGSSVIDKYDRLLTLRVGSLFNATWDNIFAEVSFLFSQGLLNVDQTQTSKPDSKGRFSKLGIYSIFNYNTSFGVSVLAIINGQWGFHSLPHAEEIQYGGSLVGRGYNAGDISGDSGIGGVLELRYDGSFLPHSLPFSQLFISGDGGVARHKGVAFDKQNDTVASFSLGWRFGFRVGLNGELRAGFPFIAPTDNEFKAYQPRFFFKLGWNF